jgi:hypothetical protein
VLITGTVGAGKSTTADKIGDALQAQGVPHAVIDLDEIRRFWPTPADDPFGFEVELRNLRPLAANYVASGARRLVLAGVCETRDDRLRYEVTMGLPLVVCRLHASLPVLRARLELRHVNDPVGLRWHLGRAGQLDAILDAADVADFQLEVDSRSPHDVAAEILKTLEWARSRAGHDAE